MLASFVILSKLINLVGALTINIRAPIFGLFKHIPLEKIIINGSIVNVLGIAFLLIVKTKAQLLVIMVLLSDHS